MFEFEGQTYTAIRGSDVNPRDGMYLELRTAGRSGEIAEVYYSDQTHQFTVNTFENSIPLPLLEWLIGQARQLLPALE